MEFGEKLQALRKSKGLTQEELAESLYVSRTAVSKWESGRGYPSIDSLKEIASFFSVTIDELLTGERILSLAEKENRQNIQKLCNLLFGIVDQLTLLLVVLPLYPNPGVGHVESVNLLRLTGTSSWIPPLYWALFLGLTAMGALKVVLTQCSAPKGQWPLTWCSLGLGILGALLLIGTRQVYAAIIGFALFLIKGILYLKMKEKHN